MSTLLSETSDTEERHELELVAGPVLGMVLAVVAVIILVLA